jgi:hypothetical protein
MWHFNTASQHEKQMAPATTATSVLVEVRIRQPQYSCPLYAWDHNHAALKVIGIYQTQEIFPVNLATTQLEGQKDITTLVLASYSFPPDTQMSARIIGSLQYRHPDIVHEQTLPLDDWILLTVADIDTTFASCPSIEYLSPEQRTSLECM